MVVDEAYVDFGGESAACLLGRYDNLLVVGTFSKAEASRARGWVMPWAARRSSRT